MIIKKLNKENAIILCGHGSRDSDYKNEMLGLKIKLEEHIQHLQKIIPNQIYGYEDDTMEGVVGQLLSEKNETVSTAESCTGGMISSAIVHINGSSQIFKSSVIVYSNDMKSALLNIPNDLITKNFGHIKLLQTILDESGYSAMLKNKKDIDNENRLENIKELLSAMKEFDNLESFLEHVSLATSVDQEWDGEKINMMTMHAAKGLEFDVVFLPGWEEGLFPHQKSIEEKGQNGLEEERRLAYVGITRAKKKAIISFSMNRFYQGDWIDSMASRFIDELPDKNIEKNSFFDEEINNDEDFEFNQDFEIEEGTRSPGWIRYQKRIK